MPWDTGGRLLKEDGGASGWPETGGMKGNRAKTVMPKVGLSAASSETKAELIRWDRRASNAKGISESDCNLQVHFGRHAVFN